jgi:predicted nucleotide-binding protein (sugar kinase/HSP70/actin superfamily)
VSVEAKKYFCPKFLGLPEIVRCCVSGLPEILSPEINIAKKPVRTRVEICRLAARFDRRPWVIDRALAAANEAHAAYKKLLQSGCTPQEALDGGRQACREGKIRVAVLGHVYNVNDNYFNCNLLAKLREMEVEIVTVEMLPAEAFACGGKWLEKESFWSFGHELLGAGCFLLQEKSVQGLILVAAFGCGPDSLICELLARYYKRSSSIPVLLLTLDEHSGEAGLVTRLEAFIDMLRRREAV